MSNDIKHEFSGDINGKWRLEFSYPIDEFNRRFVNETDEEHIEKVVKLGRKMQTRNHLKEIAENVRLMQMYLDAMEYKEGEA
jgi:hypothetical protein